MIEIKRNGFKISSDKSLLDIGAIHLFLSKYAYWSKNIPFETVKRSIDNSLCFGIYKLEEQIGFARIISDFSTVAYLGDVYVLDSYRGFGLSKWLMEVIMSHPDLQNLRRWILLTGDAHTLYHKFGWKPIADSTKWMEIHNPGVYQ